MKSSILRPFVAGPVCLSAGLLASACGSEPVHQGAPGSGATAGNPAGGQPASGGTFPTGAGGTVPGAGGSGGAPSSGGADPGSGGSGTGSGGAGGGSLPVDCSAIQNNPNWELCEEGPDFCAAVFNDGAGCAAVCASVGMSCAERWENLEGACAANTHAAPLSCDDPIAHQSDYCVCSGDGGNGGNGGAVGTGGAAGTGGVGGSGGAGGTAGSGGDGGSGGTGGVGGSGGTGGSGGSVGSSDLVGWGADPACGPNGTTGGEGGPTVTVTSAGDLRSAASGDGPRVIHVSGKINLGGSQLSVGSNKSLIGVNGAEIAGFTRVSGENIIFKNIKFNGAATSGDTVEVTGTTCMWIDHCEFYDGSDGNLDIVRGSDLITVSWSRFYYVERNHSHRLSNLCGNQDSDTPGKINITFHHNWWGSKVLQRMPRVRHGKVHVFNNYYSSSGNDYCIAAGYRSKLLVENNYFDGVNHPIRWMSDQGTAEVVERGNLYVDSDGDRVTRGSSFTPPYAYALDAAQDVKASVMAGAGAR